MLRPLFRLLFFFFNDTATTEIYTLSLHDALPISPCGGVAEHFRKKDCMIVFWLICASFVAIALAFVLPPLWQTSLQTRSEEHTSELQSQSNLVCRLLLEKKKNSIPVL